MGAPAAHNVAGFIEVPHLKHAGWAIAVAVAMAILLASVAAADSGRKMYKWVDAQGVTHFGDQIPPEFASQERHVINKQGVEVDRLDAQKSADQIAAEDKARMDAATRAARDRNLLNTYVSVQEIERLRDQRLALLSDQIKVTSQFLDTLNGRLKKIRANSMHFKPYSDDPKAPAMPDQMAEDLVRTGNDIRTQEQNLREKHNEQDSMSVQFQSDIDRFKELKGIH
jgi:hypothetical protein